MSRQVRKFKYINYKPDIYECDEEKNVRYLLGNKGEKTLLCIGINPSWACKEFSDPTMNWLVKMSKQEGYDSCIMMNPYPLRCSKPRELPKEFDKDILNTNFEWFDKVFLQNKKSDVLVMWGNYIDENADFRAAVIKILEKSIKYKMKLFYINDLSKNGHPYHFSYLKWRNAEFKNGIYEKKDLDIPAYIDKLK